MWDKWLLTIRVESSSAFGCWMRSLMQKLCIHPVARIRTSTLPKSHDKDFRSTPSLCVIIPNAISTRMRSWEAQQLKLSYIDQFLFLPLKYIKTSARWGCRQLRQSQVSRRHPQLQCYQLQQHRAQELTDTRIRRDSWTHAAWMFTPCL